ncbi:phospholipase A2 inhibitor and Ly6/PLAUR domain-containing protein-like [Hemicordylus capensis]|uniref:phospholipase A2 inhibitor and Ly6/PLAUR domain-containing protein-like n=1 Tax=Hemicordylus capensis TaxID=884348 RepID=UPI0023038AAE|nr:phospholipase A2 inhibitor and Ly6/PLAUR domain-containing protein-like [Hemicordylus capensis]
MQTCLVFSAFFTLVAAEDLLSCEDCIAPGATCQGEKRLCFLGEDTCGSFLGETNFGMVGSRGTLKTCTEYQACRAGIRTMTVGAGIILRRSALCCKTENCQGESAKLPPINTIQNGFQCPVCFAQDSVSCKAERTVNCTGSENHCVYITGTLESLVNITATSSRFAARGCATQSVCEQSGEMSVFSGTATYTLSTIEECRPAHIIRNSAHLHHHRPLSLDTSIIWVTLSFLYFLLPSDEPVHLGL